MNAIPNAFISSRSIIMKTICIRSCGTNEWREMKEKKICSFSLCSVFTWHSEHFDVPLGEHVEIVDCSFLISLLLIKALFLVADAFRWNDHSLAYRKHFLALCIWTVELHDATD